MAARMAMEMVDAGERPVMALQEDSPADTMEARLAGPMEAKTAATMAGKMVAPMAAHKVGMMAALMVAQTAASMVVLVEDIVVALPAAALMVAVMVGAAAAHTGAPLEDAMEGTTAEMWAAQVARVEVVPQAAALGGWAEPMVVEATREGCAAGTMVEPPADSTGAAAVVPMAAQPAE